MSHENVRQPLNFRKNLDSSLYHFDMNENVI